MDQENILTPDQLNYKQLLINHIDRISRLSATLFDKQRMNDHEGTVYNIGTKTAKYDSFRMAIRVLKAIIPESLIDSEFAKSLETLNKDYNAKMPIDDVFLYNCKMLNLIINLLNRKGLLFQDMEILK